MSEEIKSIEINDFFVKRISSFKDEYQDTETFLNNGIKDNFKKVVDNVKPIRDFRPCTDDEMEKYHLSYNKDIYNALDYEKCYRILLDQVKEKTTDEKVAFLVPYVPYLRGLLHAIGSAVDDNEAFNKYHKNQTIAYLLVYRYEHDISILDDLHMQLSEYDVDMYNASLSEKLAEEKIERLVEMKKNHPDDYEQMIDTDMRFFNKTMERIETKWKKRKF